MDSIVYDFSTEGDKELEYSHDIWFYRDEYMSARREAYRDEYAELVKSIQKFKNRKEIYDYLVNNDNTLILKDDLELFNLKWINQDAELIEWVKTTPSVMKCNLLYGISRVRMRIEDNKKKLQELYSHTDNLKKMLLNCRTVKGYQPTYFAVCIQNPSYLNDPEILDILTHSKYYQYEEDSIERLIDNKKLDNVFLLKTYFSIEGEQRKYFAYHIDKILSLFDDEEVIKKEIENLIHIIRISIRDGYVDDHYMAIYDFPRYKDENLRQYIYNLALSYVETKDNLALGKYLKSILEALNDEQLQNNEKLLKAFSHAAGWLHAHLLLSCFKDKRIVQNEDLTDLIVKMPNFYTLEQLMLAYETKEIGDNIDILTEIASYSPDVKLMESVRKKYGQSFSEKERMKRVKNAESEHQEQIEKEYYKETHFHQVYVEDPNDRYSYTRVLGK